MKKIKYLLFGIMSMLMSMPIVFADTDYTKYIACGNSAIPAPIPGITRVLVLLLQVVLPIVIIVMGSIDFLKAVATSDGEKIKNGQKQFIRRIITAFIFFIVISITKFVVNISSDIAGEDESISKCINCLISNKTECGELTDNGPFDIQDKKEKDVN